MAKTAMPPPIENSTLPVRVSVLEHGVQELKSGLDGHRGETRIAFSSLQNTLERMSADIASRAQPTNWFGFIGAIGATVATLAMVLGLAEWRVTAAVAPIDAFRVERGVVLRQMAGEIQDLKVSMAVLQAEHARVKIEQEARIRSRVEAEARAQERLVPPPK